MPSTSPITYDRSADAIAITLNPAARGRPVTHELSPHIRADYIGTQLVSLEILDASAILPAAALEQLGTARVMLSIAAAAREAKREPRTIRAAAAAGRIDGAVKEGRDWFVPRAGLWNYLEQLGPAGRPPKAKRAPHRKRTSSHG